ncbi:TlpA disulfide reductase family protein [Vitiosangium sp. GDMCC 1.1324]|uniref:TlpA disulfide reductase family protein n=1 Tax=Vitiosangium sp. (strain GDMCC 1.1324) TaxID=2138576 RepID=UPI000D36435F|nr:TlpA disulfide reductase family protein [Vitiosangium sp. GDMCC 1.1324]PTL77912.1 TlpA family protein disulfide reductase [Vitiosangium sp. GDMCC 1.1324]
MTEQRNADTGQQPGAGQESAGAGQPPARQGWSKVVLVVTGLLGLAGLSYLGVQEALRARLASDGMAAPSVKMKTYKGETLSLADLKGKVVMLDFWATWCPPCQAEMPSLIKLAKEYEGKGLVFVAASRDEMPDAPMFVEEFVVSRMPELGQYVVYAPDEVAGVFQVTALPTLYFLDREGRVVDAQRGALSEDALRQRIERALKQ